ncbi:MAG: hypothetical protein GY931_16760 [Maribacter sp.]|nr:hypothetical protein [Maribacter sp.]
MFGILYLVIIPLGVLLYVYAVRTAVKNSTLRVKKRTYILFLWLPAIYPFLHLVSPNYFHFLSACEQAEDYMLIKPIKTRIFPAPMFSEGYRAILEQPYAAFSFDGTNYTPTTQFRSAKCENICAKYYLNHVKKCIDNKCVKIGLDFGGMPLEFEWKYSSSNSRGVFNSLLYTSKTQLIHKEHGVIAERYKHRFYPYGDGWASFFGAASGEAPSYKCSIRPRFNFQEIAPPQKGV